MFDPRPICCSSLTTAVGGTTDTNFVDSAHPTVARIMKHFIKQKGRENEDSNLLVYEQFDTTFEEWLKVNESVKEGNLTKLFLQILRWVRRLSYLCRFEV